LSFAGKWIELEVIMLNEISQVQVAKFHLFSFIWEPRSKMMTMLMRIMGHECSWGLSGGINERERWRGKDTDK
jgi:hypothetical protein